LIFISLPDKWLIYVAFLSNVLYLDFIFKGYEFFDKGHSLLEIMLPITFIILLFRRLFKKDINFQFVLTQSWPFLLFFAIVCYWFAHKGMMPTIISGKDSAGMGNFSILYNNLLNILALLFPFVAILKKEELTSFLRLLLLILIIKTVFLVIHILSQGSFYLPLFIPFDSDLSRGVNSEVNRIGEISSLSFALILYTLFFGRDIKKILKYLIIFFAISVNIIWGGGRTELICSVFVIMFVDLIRCKQILLRDMLGTAVKFIGTVIALVILFNLFSAYIPSDQQKRFGEIINLKQAYENRIGEDYSRIEMWSYAIREGLKKPLLGHGFSQHWNFEEADVAAHGMVQMGGAHNKYLQIFYSFGAGGLFVFFYGSKKFLSKLIILKKRQPHLIWDFLTLYFLTTYLFKFNFEGGIIGFLFMFYFFIGYILAYPMYMHDTEIEQINFQENVSK
jgi:hypothetical protein